MVFDVDNSKSQILKSTLETAIGMIEMKLTECVKGWKDTHILVVGDVFLDHYAHGVAEYNPDNPAVPKIRVTHNSYHPGGAGNVAANLASLGARVSLVGFRGEDKAGLQLEASCLDRTISPYLTVVDKSTITKVRALAQHPGHYMARIDWGEENLTALQTSAYESIKTQATEFIGTGSVDAVVLSDYAKYMYSGTLATSLITCAKWKDIPVFVDPKPKNIDKFWRATLVRPNRVEAESIMGKLDLDLLPNALRLKMECDYSVITCGKDGLVASSCEEYCAIPSYATQAVNHTGAGDTFMAGLVISLVNKASFKQSLHIASYAAAAVVEKPDTATVTRDELIERIHPFGA